MILDDKLFDLWAVLGFLGRFDPSIHALIYPRGSIDADEMGYVIYLTFEHPNMDLAELTKRWLFAKLRIRRCGWFVTQDGDAEGCFRIPNADLTHTQAVELANLLGIKS